MTISTIDPHAAAAMLAKGAQLIDVRGTDEHGRERIAGSRNVPLDALTTIDGGAPVIFHCRSGQRTRLHAARLAAAGGTDSYLLDGGIDAWKATGLPIVSTAKQPFDLMRQVQIAGGTLVLLSILLGWLVSPALLLIGAAVGVGMLHAGISGSCAMTTLLAPMPWNRAVAN